MHTNIPTEELITIIKTACQNNTIEDKLKQNIIKPSKTTIDQNYFQFLDKTYVQPGGAKGDTNLLYLLRILLTILRKLYDT